MVSRYFYSNRLTILMYHGVVAQPLKVPDWCFVDRQVFTEQMEYVSANFEILALSDAVEKLRAGRIRNPTLSITFDDGFLNNYEVVYPIISLLNIPVTIYISTQFVDSEDTLWYCRLNRAVSQTGEKRFRWNGVGYSIQDTDLKARLSSVIQKKLKKLAHEDLLTELDRIINALGVQAETGTAENSPFRMLDSQSIQLMCQSGIVEIGAHTHSHAILSRLSLPRKREEIVKSIRLIEKWTKSHCRTFAYPNGGPGDYDLECIDLLRSCGIETAVTGIPHTDCPYTSPYELGRFGIGANTSFGSFRRTVHGLSPTLTGCRAAFRQRTRYRRRP